METEKKLFKMYGKFYPQGAILFKEGDPGGEMYIIQSGSISLVAGGEEKKLGAGDILGDGTLLEQYPHTATAVAEEDCRLLAFDSAAVDGLARNGPELARLLQEQLAGRLEREGALLRDWTVSYALKKVEPHIRAGTGEIVDPVLLAEAAGVEEAVLGDVLALLVREGGLALRDGTLRVADGKLLDRCLETADNPFRPAGGDKGGR